MNTPEAPSTKAHRNVALYAEGAPAAQHQIPLIIIPRRERLYRAGKIFSFFLIAAVMAIAIPMLHFVLVPALSIIGILLAINEYWDDVRLGEAALVCPKCHAPIELDDKKDLFPKWTTCKKCQSGIRIAIDTPQSTGPERS